MYQTRTPHASAIGPATARLRGATAEVTLMTTVSTRPCISGATIVCSKANAVPLAMGFMNPPMKAPTRPSHSAVGGARAISRVDSAMNNHPVNMVTMRRRKPPHMPKASPPNRKPTPWAEFIQPNSSGPPSKCLVTKMGMSAEPGFPKKLHRAAMMISQNTPRH